MGGKSEETIALGRALKRLRNEAGLTQDQVARALDISNQGYQNYERGRRNLYGSKLDRILKVLGYDRESLNALLEALPPRTECAYQKFDLEAVRIVYAGDVGETSFSPGGYGRIQNVMWTQPDQLGFQVVGSCMAPYANQGAILLCSRQQIPRSGQGCVVEQRDGHCRLLMFHFLNSDVICGSEIVPPREVTVPREIVVGCYAVLWRSE